MIYTSATPLVLQVSGAYSLRPDLLAAQIHAESAGDAGAFRFEEDYFDRYISRKPTVPGYRYGRLAACSFGLLQILLETAIEQGFDGLPQHLFDARVGLSWGAKYLQHCLAICGNDYRRALARYNGAGSRADAYASRVFALADSAAKGAHDATL